MKSSVSELSTHRCTENTTGRRRFSWRFSTKIRMIPLYCHGFCKHTGGQNSTTKRSCSWKIFRHVIPGIRVYRRSWKPCAGFNRQRSLRTHKTMKEAAQKTSGYSGNRAPRVTVVIPHAGGMEILKHCLESLRGTRYRDFQVLVVDNASTDG